MASAESQHPVETLHKMTIDDTQTALPADIVAPVEQVITPFEIEAADEYGVDYDKLIDRFGTRKIDQAILDRFEKLTGVKPHRYLRRGLFFSHRYFQLRELK
jgi:hypothetical protein